MAEKHLKVPPQDIEMERALLGALLLNQNAMYEAADVVGVDSFIPANTALFMTRCLVSTPRESLSMSLRSRAS